MNRQREVDRGDVQGNILCGYGKHFKHGLYLFVELWKDDEAARRWLRELCPQVTTAEHWPGDVKPPDTLNIAFTFEGLRHLGVPDTVLNTFPTEFKEGMANRVNRLGDRDPTEWQSELRSPHAVVMVMAQDEHVLCHRKKALRDQLDDYQGDPRVSYAQVAKVIPPDRERHYRREHFGFADGFSQPSIRGEAGPNTRKGMGTPMERGQWADVAPGEFVLGYPGEDGLIPLGPAGPLDLGSSYMVLRKLHQHVPAFRAYTRGIAERQVPFLSGQPPAQDDPDRDEKLLARQREVAARMIGRWPDGRSLVRSPAPYVPPDKTALSRLQINQFRYLEPSSGRWADPDGLACPLGAHVRRANPRDGFGWNGELTKRHRIIRRSMPYGDPAPGLGEDEKGLFDPEVEDADRGLIFVCYQASIARQFEIIQSRWLNDGDAFWLGGEKDAVSTAYGATIQGADCPTYLPRSLGDFVTTRGGGYFFAPGLPALRALASAYWR